MSSENRPRVRNSLSFRLTLWYAGIFALCSGVAFLLFYFLITSVIRDRTDRDLLEQADKFSTLLSTSGMNAVTRVAVIESQAAGERKIFFRLLSQYGSVFSSSNMQYWEDIGINRAAVTLLFQGKKPVFDTIVIPKRKYRVRVLYSVIGRGVVLQLGQSMEQYTRFIEAFRRIFVLTMASLIVLAALVGWFMARRALSGVEEVTRTARRISEGALKERVPVKPGVDEIDQMAITFNDMLDRIETLIKGIKEMSDNIAHDLKSPITRIRGLAEVTFTTETSLKEYEHMAASTIEECDRLLDMINTMLMISKTEAGVWDLKFEALDMAGIVRDACDLFHPMAEDKGVALVCHEAEPCMIQGDVRMIQRMVANLLDNAIKYTLPSGRVEVSIGRSDNATVSVSVKDTGMGISEKDLAHVFERFFRSDPSRSESGTGLGLSLAQAIAQAHGGRIDAVSTPGSGSTFTVTLPVRAQA